MALTELGALPATYRHITTTVVTGTPAASAFARLRATSRFLPPVRAAALPGHRRRLSRRARAAYFAQLVLPLVRGHMTHLILRGVKRQLSSLLVEIALQGRYPSDDICLGKLQFTALVSEFRAPLQLLGLLLGLLLPAQRAHQHLASRGVDV